MKGKVGQNHRRGEWALGLALILTLAALAALILSQRPEGSKGAITKGGGPYHLNLAPL